ncbi:MAG: alpha-amylase family glycosyl hydrolase [Nitrospinota bacterium]
MSRSLTIAARKYTRHKTQAMSANFTRSHHLAKKIFEHLTFLYGADAATKTFAQLSKILKDSQQKSSYLAARKASLSEKDAILITYADQFQSDGRPPLQVLSETVRCHLEGIVNSIHLLPFYPYSSDDGFSVIDYTRVDPKIGDWNDLASLGQGFRLMFDAVINHVSVQNHWFQGFLKDEPAYKDYFITADPNTDLSNVTRPRTQPLLTPFETANGAKHVWTTFSADQADLNYSNPKVLLEVLKVLLFYVQKGAEIIRLDAIGYLWKTIGTSCIHLPETHRIVQLIRSVLDAVAPNVMLITETNVPQHENISYFGNGCNEAQMVYNFALPPLILHSFYTGNVEALSRWAANLTTPGNSATYFNFIASHDGLGVMPAKGLLSEVEIQNLVDKTVAHGGLVSCKTNSDGTQRPYELNITLFDALSRPSSTEPDSLKINRFMSSQAIMLALRGVPGIYVHSLVGSSNNSAGVAKTGQNRTINREKWRQANLEARLANPKTIASQVFRRYRHLLQVRSRYSAFHPFGEQQIITGNPAVFSLLRTSPSGNDKIFCLHNVSAEPQVFTVDADAINSPGILHDLLSHERFSDEGLRWKITLGSYQVRWLHFTLD